MSAPASIQKSEIHRPGINPDARRQAMLSFQSEQTLLHLVVDPQYIPLETVADSNRIVREPVNFRYVNGSAVPLAQHGPATACAQIKCKNAQGFQPPCQIIINDSGTSPSDTPSLLMLAYVSAIHPVHTVSLRTATLLLQVRPYVRSNNPTPLQTDRI